MANLYLDICLSDIPKDLIKTSTNNKKYLKAIIRPRKETDRDGYDHYIAAWIPPDQRGDRPVFIGRAQDKDAKEEVRARIAGPLPQVEKPKEENNEDLPF